jgi:hypothetical protein
MCTTTVLYSNCKFYALVLKDVGKVTPYNHHPIINVTRLIHMLEILNFWDVKQPTMRLFGFPGPKLGGISLLR